MSAAEEDAVVTHARVAEVLSTNSGRREADRPAADLNLRTFQA